jgi:hypothetical protein
VKFPRNVVHTLVVPEDPLSHGVTNLPHEALHVEVLQHATDDGVR